MINTNLLAFTLGAPEVIIVLVLILLLFGAKRIPKLAKSIGQARQLVNHGHITVNKKVINIPSFQCRLEDVISVKEKNTSQNLVANNIKMNQWEKVEIPRHLKLNDSKLEATVKDYCDRDDVKLQLNELLVIEYYSRR